MGIKWGEDIEGFCPRGVTMKRKKWHSTGYKGIRYYEHPTRKHGAVTKDRYFAIRYQRDGKRKEEGLGWASEGWSLDKANEELSKLRNAAKTAEGPARLSEKREAKKAAEIAKEAARSKLEKDKLTVREYFEKTYYPISKSQKKEPSHEETHFRLWIEPVIGHKPLKDLAPLDIERIKKQLQDKNKAPRTIQYILATVRQMWNMARRDGRVSGDSPTRSVKVPKFDNRRQRFLSKAEADAVIHALRERSEQLYRIALVGLWTGMRASEIFRLTWGCVDTDRGLITILDAKSGRGRTAIMTEQLKASFLEMQRGKNDDLVFPHTRGGPHLEIPTLFRDVVAELKFNEGVSDRRQRVCFHTLRHTYGSWHAEAGTDLYVIKELLGHGSITLTERYSHLTNGALRNAVRDLEKTIEGAKQEETDENIVKLPA